MWKPSADQIAKTNMSAFMQFVKEKHGKTFQGYDDFHLWSIENIESFWDSFLEFTDIVHDGSSYHVLDTHKMPGFHWFSGLKLNYAENILNREHKGTAIVSIIEHDPDKENFENFKAEYSFMELYDLVFKCIEGLKREGVQKNDFISGYLANIPEAIVLSLACSAIGAVWTSASPDFGLDALYDRFSQIKPKLMFASTHYRYNQKTHYTTEVVNELAKRIPSIEKVIAIPYPVGEAPHTGNMEWAEFLKDNGNDISGGDGVFTMLPFDHPLYILFSSGTTGAPKCIVHGAGGTLLQHRKELQLHCDLKENDRLLFFTTTGWMMWNWQLSALSLGATICLFDGNPGFPSLTSIWKIVNKLSVTHFGTSGRFLESCMKAEYQDAFKQIGPLPALSSVLYTGSPLSPTGFYWLYNTIKKDLQLSGISGGTDIISCFILGNPNLPVFAGEIQCKGLGVDIRAFNEEGQSVVNSPGELVCLKPIPSMPVGFLNDQDNKKYYNAYFSDYPGVWTHGDYIEFTENNGIIVYGRSDATLNPGGVRLGSGEIYSALDHLEFVTGAVAVGWAPPGRSDEVIVLLLTIRGMSEPDSECLNTIKRTIKEKRSPRHVPQHIFKISEIPVTRSGKTVELTVKAIFAGKPVKNKHALANPYVLEELERIRDRLLKSYKNSI